MPSVLEGLGPVQTTNIRRAPALTGDSTFRPTYYDDAMISDDCIQYEAFDSKDKPLTVMAWAELLAEKTSRGKRARQKFITVLRNSPFDGLFFETPGVKPRDSSKLQFRFVLIDSPELYEFGQRGSDPETFSKHFHRIGRHESVTFDNLGGDARLVVPHPKLSRSNHRYSHLKRFIEKALPEQVDCVIGMMAAEYLKQLTGKSREPV